MSSVHRGDGLDARRGVSNALPGREISWSAAGLMGLLAALLSALGAAAATADICPGANFGFAACRRRLPGLAALAVVLGACWLGLPSSAGAQSQCPSANPTYNGTCGPTFTLPQWGDAGGWRDYSQNRTIQFGDVLGNGQDQLIGRTADGIEIWDFDTSVGQWRPAVDAQGQPMILTGFADPPPLTAANPSFTGTDWTSWDHAGSIQVGDVLGTGHDQIIARGSPGITVWSYTPGANGAPGTWSQPYAGEPFSDDDGYAGLLGLIPTFSIKTADLTGDGKDDLFAVTPGGTIVAYEWNGGGFTQLPATNVAIPLAPSSGLATLQASPSIDGRQEIWWDAPFGMLGLRLNDAGSGWSFVSQKTSFGVGPFPFDESAPTPWGSGPAYYGTIRLVNVLGSPARQVVGRGTDGLDVYQLSSNGSWTQLPTLTALSDANGFNQQKYWDTIRYANLDGAASGQQEVIARGPNGVVAYRYDATAGQWNQLPGSIGLADDPWGADASYYGTFHAGDASGDGKQDTLIARGPYGIRTWFYNRPGQSGWSSYLPSAYPQFTGNDQTAYAALNDLALLRGWRKGNQSTVRDLVTADFSAGNVPANLTNLPSELATLCTGQKTYTPPSYQSCRPPASDKTAAKQDWTGVVNVLLAEAWNANQVAQLYSALNTINQDTFVAQNAELPAIAGDLDLSAATNTPTSYDLTGLTAGWLGIAASATFENPALSAGLWITSELVSMIPSASPTLTSQFNGTYNQLQTAFASGISDADAQLDSQSLQIRSDPNLSKLVGELQQAGTWSIDEVGATSASNQAFAQWVYNTLLPSMYTRYGITGCQTHLPDLICTGPAAGPGVVGSPPDFTAIGPPIVPEDTNRVGTPCEMVHNDYQFSGPQCDYESLDPSIGNDVWGLVQANCDYQPGAPDPADTVWKFGTCDLGVNPMTSVTSTQSSLVSTKEGWDFPTASGNPDTWSAYVTGAAVRAGVGRASSLRRAATVRLRGVVGGRRVGSVDLSRARIVIDRVLFDPQVAGELVRWQRPPADGRTRRAREAPATSARPQSVSGTRLRKRGTGVFGSRPSGRSERRPTVELKLAHRSRGSLAFDLRVAHISLPVLNAACEFAEATPGPSLPFTLTTKMRVLQAGHKPVLITLNPTFTCQRDATGAIRALSVKQRTPPRLGRGLSLRLEGPRHAVAGRLSTLKVTVRNRSRSLAQDLIVRAYLPRRLRVVDLPRGAKVRGDRVVWRFSKLRRRHTRSLRLRVVSARTGRRCTAVSADAVLRRHTTAKACIDVRAAAPPRVTG